MSQDVPVNLLEVLRFTPRDVKLGLREGRLKLEEGLPKIPLNRSTFQRRRIRASFPMVMRYLRKNRTVNELAKEFAVTHQRVSQVLSLGVEFLIEARHITVIPDTNGNGSAIQGS